MGSPLESCSKCFGHGVYEDALISDIDVEFVTDRCDLCHGTGKRSILANRSTDLATTLDYLRNGHCDSFAGKIIVFRRTAWLTYHVETDIPLPFCGYTSAFYGETTRFDISYDHEGYDFQKCIH